MFRQGASPWPRATWRRRRLRATRPTVAPDGGRAPTAVATYRSALLTLQARKRRRLTAMSPTRRDSPEHNSAPGARARVRGTSFHMAAARRACGHPRTIPATNRADRRGPGLVKQRQWSFDSGGPLLPTGRHNARPAAPTRPPPIQTHTAPSPGNPPSGAAPDRPSTPPHRLVAPCIASSVSRTSSPPPAAATGTAATAAAGTSAGL